MDNGKTLELRLMGRGDRDEIVRFARALPKQDLLFLRIDITRPAQRGRLDRQRRGRAVGDDLAYEGAHLAGYATLHHNEVLWTRHVGEIGTNVGPDYRGIRLSARLVGDVRRREGDRAEDHRERDVGPKAARATFERIASGRKRCSLTTSSMRKGGRTTC